MTECSYDHFDPDGYRCAKCGSDDCERQQCWHCHGEGGFDLHDEDAVNFAPGEETETCEECHGQGEYWFCHACARAASKVKR